MFFFHSHYSAEPNVRNQFTLGWHRRKYSCEFYKKTLIDTVRSHQYDYNSPAAMSTYYNHNIFASLSNDFDMNYFFIVAGLTGQIRYNQHVIFDNVAFGSYRRRCKWNTILMMRTRMELLRRLRETDYKQYEWLLERLDLQYKPKPDEENTILIARKEGLRRLTDAYCSDVRQQRLNEYRVELEAQQLPFLEQKLKNLIFIRNEQIDMKVDVTIAQEQIDETRERYEKLKKENDENKAEPTNKKWKVY